MEFKLSLPSTQMEGPYYHDQGQTLPHPDHDQNMTSDTSEPHTRYAMPQLPRAAQASAYPLPMASLMEEAEIPVPNLLLERFTMFPKLPMEVQSRIWELSLEENRIVKVRFSDRPRSSKHDFISTVPTVLQICQGSRQEGLRHYKLDLVTRHSLNKAYFNFNTDILYIDWYEYDIEDERVNKFASLLKKENRNKLRRILTHSCSTYDEAISPERSPSVCRFPELEEWILFITIDTACARQLPHYLCPSPKKIKDTTIGEPGEILGRLGDEVFVDKERLQHMIDQFTSERDSLSFEEQRGNRINSDLGYADDFIKCFKDGQYGKISWKIPKITIWGQYDTCCPGIKLVPTSIKEWGSKMHNTRSKTAASQVAG